jgi:hypothetical protein
MGKGSNASKIARAREDAAKRDAVAPGGGGKAGMDVRRGITTAMIQCKVCMQSFPGTMSKSQLTEHQESKHAKSTFAACYPTFVG